MKLPVIGMHGVGVQARAVRAVVEVQALEVRVQDAEEHVHVRRRRGDGELPLVMRAIFQREREGEPRDHAMRGIEPQRERIEETAEDEEERFECFDFALEVERLGKLLRRSHEP